MQKYKVFFNNKVLIITNQLVGNINFDIVYDSNRIILEKVISSMMQADGGNQKIALLGENVEQLWQKFCTHFKKIQAAGGVVRNMEYDTLFIKRRGLWDLPKGKCEQKETIEQCAEREIEEECGIQGLILQKKIIDTYHTYILKNQKILKKTSWFLFAYPGNQIPKPQIEESITEIKWLSDDDIQLILTNSYLSIFEVMNALNIL